MEATNRTTAPRVTPATAAAVVGAAYLLFFGQPIVNAIILRDTTNRPPIDYSSPWQLASAVGDVGQIAGTLLLLWLVLRWLPLTPAAVGVGGPRRPYGMLCTVGLATIGLFVANEVLSHLKDPAVITNSKPLVNSWAALAFIGDIRAGITEEIIIVAIPVLVGLRAGWSPAWVVALSIVFRWPFHIYHGLWSSLPWTVIWGGSFAAAFVLWRRLLPLIVLHTVYDSANTADSLGGADWRAAVYIGAMLFLVLTFAVGLYRQRRDALDGRLPRLTEPTRV